MRISYISQSTVPSRSANSIHVMKMCQAFARNGHEVRLLAMDDVAGREPGVEDAYDFHGVERSFDLVHLPVPRVRGGNALYGLLSGLRAGRSAPDLVYARHLAGCFFAARRGLPVVLEVHHPWDDRRRGEAWMFRKIAASKCLRRLVVITHALKAYHEERYPELVGKIRVAPDGADPVGDDVHAVVLQNAGERLQVGYVGHLYAGKGMEVVSELARKCPWADFHVVGGKDEDRARWQARCADTRNLTFHGHVAPNDVARYMLALDVALLPNQPFVGVGASGARDIGPWTSPLKAFEYFAARRAIIASDLPVLREILRHESNALLCAPRDIEDWVRSLERLRDDPALRARLGQAGLDAFRKSYTWQARAENVLRD